MILYTPLPVEQVLEGFEKEAPELIELNIGSIKVIVQQTGMTKAVVHRIISTDPQDYLKPELQPGSVIDFQMGLNS